MKMNRNTTIGNTNIPFYHFLDEQEVDKKEEMEHAKDGEEKNDEAEVL